MMAELFFAKRAGEAGVRVLGKIFRLAVNVYLPLYKKCERQRNKTVCVDRGDEQKRREHHCEIPIIYTTACAAFVFHYPSLEWAEEKNTYDVANRKCERNQHQYALVYPSDEVDGTDAGVQREPNKRDKQRYFCRLSQRRRIFVCRYIVALELLLTAHAFVFRREKAKRHFNGKNKPNSREQERLFFNRIKVENYLVYAGANIHYKRGNEKHGAPCKLKIMLDVNGGILFL